MHRQRRQSVRVRPFGHGAPRANAHAHAGAMRSRRAVRTAWTDIAAWAPEILIVSPCGFGVEKAVEQANLLLQQPGWSGLPAVRNNRVFAVNANAYFARPGPRVVDGVELLAHLIHPQLFDWEGSLQAFQRLEVTN